LLRPPGRDGHPFLANIVVYPSTGVDLVKFERRLRGANPREIRYQQWQITLRRPFRPLERGRRGVVRPSEAPRPDYSVRDYLTDVAKEHKHVSFRYAWWKEPKATLALWTMGGLVLVGGVWPTVVNLLVGAGFGRRREKDPEYDLDRFQGEPEVVKPAPPATVGMEDHLRELEEELAQNLKAGVATTAAPQPEQPVAKLTGEKLQVEATPEVEEHKEYKGDFYPVVRKVEHKPKQ
jgi:hypothetical protein